MTLLYDVAVITDYSRRKNPDGNEAKRVQHENQTSIGCCLDAPAEPKNDAVFIDTWQSNGAGNIDTNIDTWHKTSPGNLDSWQSNASGNIDTWQGKAAGNIETNIDRWHKTNTRNIDTWRGNAPGNIDTWRGNAPGNIDTWQGNATGNIETNIDRWHKANTRKIDRWHGNPPGNIDRWHGNPPGNIDRWHGNPPGNIDIWHGNPPGNIDRWQNVETTVVRPDGSCVEKASDYAIDVTPFESTDSVSGYYSSAGTISSYQSSLSSSLDLEVFGLKSRRSSSEIIVYSQDDEIESEDDTPLYVQYVASSSNPAEDLKNKLFKKRCKDGYESQPCSRNDAAPINNAQAEGKDLERPSSDVAEVENSSTSWKPRFTAPANDDQLPVADSEDAAALEEGLRRVALQLYDLDPDLMMTSQSDATTSSLVVCDARDDKTDSSAARGDDDDGCWRTVDSGNQTSSEEWMSKPWLFQFQSTRTKSLIIGDGTLDRQSQSFSNDVRQTELEPPPAIVNELTVHYEDSVCPDIDGNACAGNVGNQTTGEIHNLTSQQPLYDPHNITEGGTAGTANEIGIMSMDDGCLNDANVNTNATTTFKPRNTSIVAENYQLSLPFEYNSIQNNAMESTMNEEKDNYPLDLVYNKFRRNDDRKHPPPKRPFVIKKTYNVDPPYNCRIPHGDDFSDIPKFIRNGDLITGKRLSEKNAVALLSISQRIVRVRVNKPYQPADPSYERNDLDTFTWTPRNLTREELDARMTDHYGTGFAFYVTFDKIEVRTHSRLVRSADEAAKTEIQFNIFVPEIKHWLRVDCAGQADGFKTNVHSQTSVVTCVTPLKLKPHLYLFIPVPVHIETSLFSDSTTSSCESNDEANGSAGTDRAECPEEDSPENRADNTKCEINLDDGSANTSLRLNKPTEWIPEVTEKEEEEEESSAVFTENEVCLETETTDKIATEEVDASGVSSCCEESDSYRPDCHNERIDLQFPEENYENPFEYCGIEESVIRDIFKSVIHTDDQKCPLMSIITNSSGNQCGGDLRGDDAGNLPRRTPVPLLPTPGFAPVIPRTTQDSAKSKPGTSPDVPGVNGYQPFDSFASDLLESLIPTKKHFLDCSLLCMPSGKWDYESMLYIQNHYSDEYSELFKPTSRSDFVDDSPGDLQDEKRPDSSHLFRSKRDHNNNENVNNTSTKDDGSESVQDAIRSSHHDDDDGSESVQDARRALHDDDPWDYDLLGLDSELFFVDNKTYEDYQMEKFVEDILSDDSTDDMLDDLINNNIRRHHQPMSAIRGQDTILISYPHGGKKQVSHGKLSTPTGTTPGGEFYETPSCFGSCGAPLLSFTASGDLYVTTVVHNGTTKLGEKGRCKGFGLSYLSQSDDEFSQCKLI